MSEVTIILASTAASLGLVHTILGPDHYLPFIVLAQSRKWSRIKTAMITLLCGLGHILSSVILGVIGLLFGIAVFKLEVIESWRGDIAAWILIIFGVTYFIWGLHRAIRNRPHKHFHFHQNGKRHSHVHQHIESHSHVHDSNRDNLTPWLLFIIFVFGPCEPLIPLLIYPAATHNYVSAAIVAAIFGLTTIITMLIIVMSAVYGLSKLSWQKMERFAHVTAGLMIFLCGAATKFFGL